MCYSQGAVFTARYGLKFMCNSGLILVGQPGTAISCLDEILGSRRGAVEAARGVGLGGWWIVASRRCDGGRCCRSVSVDNVERYSAPAVACAL